MAERTAMQEWLTEAAAQRARSGTVRTTDTRRNPRTNGSLLDLASNDYLGLAGDPRLRAAAAAATREFGTGAGASRVVTGTTGSHAEAEHELALLTGQPSCLVFSSGYTANIGLLTALGDPGTLLVTDEHVHASLIDGARLSRSPVEICPHRDLGTLDGLLRTRAQPRAIVAIESVYSVLGDAADIARTAAICAAYDALLVVDEAHGIGVAGGGSTTRAFSSAASGRHRCQTASPGCGSPHGPPRTPAGPPRRRPWHAATRAHDSPPRSTRRERGYRMNGLPKIIFVTGTDTGVGKTIATAALAAALVARGRAVAVYKPAQAGTDDGQGDIDVVRRLAGLSDVHEGIRLADAMAPVAAAARAGVRLPSAHDHAAAIRHLAAARDHTLVEGAGGLLVALDKDGRTLADIAMASGPSAAAVIVCRSGLGTLNHTELTIEALTRRGITIHGLVIGSWPGHPTEIDTSNRDHLSGRAVPVIGIIPEGAGTLAPAEFATSAAGWFKASW